MKAYNIRMKNEKLICENGNFCRQVLKISMWNHSKNISSEDAFGIFFQFITVFAALEIKSCGVKAIKKLDLTL